MSKWFKNELGKVMTGCPHRWNFNEYLDFFSMYLYIPRNDILSSESWEIRINIKNVKQKLCCCKNMIC